MNVGRFGHGTDPVDYPGKKRLQDDWINNIEGYQCNKVQTWVEGLGGYPKLKGNDLGVSE